VASAVWCMAAGGCCCVLIWLMEVPTDGMMCGEVISRMIHLRRNVERMDCWTFWR
jgi:hypothetical protein